MRFNNAGAVGLRKLSPTYIEYIYARSKIRNMIPEEYSWNFKVEAL